MWFLCEVQQVLPSRKISHYMRSKYVKQEQISPPPKADQELQEAHLEP